MVFRFDDPVVFDRLIVDLEFQNPSKSKIRYLWKQSKLILDDKDIDIIYPKNIFNDKDVLLYLFKKNGKIIESKMHEEKVTTKVLDLKNIYSFTIVIDTAEVNCLQLIINFSDGCVITFDSKDDSNNSWRGQYNEQIENIIKLLS